MFGTAETLRAEGAVRTQYRATGLDSYGRKVVLSTATLWNGKPAWLLDGCHEARFRSIEDALQAADDSAHKPAQGTVRIEEVG